MGWPSSLAVLVLSPALGLAFDRFLFRHIPTAVDRPSWCRRSVCSSPSPSCSRSSSARRPRRDPADLWLSPDHRLPPPVLHPGERHRARHHRDHRGRGGRAGGPVPLDAPSACRCGPWSRAGAWPSSKGSTPGRWPGTAWALSSALAGLAGVLMPPLYAHPDDSNDFTTLLVAGLTAAALASLRSIPLALVGGLCSGWSRTSPAGYLPPGASWQTGLPGPPLRRARRLLLFNPPGMRHLDESTDPLAVGRPAPAPPRSIRDPAPGSTGSSRWAGGSCSSWPSWSRRSPGSRTTGSSPWPPGVPSRSSSSRSPSSPGWAASSRCARPPSPASAASPPGSWPLHFGMPILLGGPARWPPGRRWSGSSAALPALRLSGLPLTLVTLAFAISPTRSLFQYSLVGGRATGLTVPRPGARLAQLRHRRAPVRFLDPGLMVIWLWSCAGASWSSKGRWAGTWPPCGAARRGGQPGHQPDPGQDHRLRPVGRHRRARAGRSTARSSSVSAGGLQLRVLARLRGGRDHHGGGHGRRGRPGRHGLRRHPAAAELPARPGSTGIDALLFAFGTLTYAAHPEGIVEYQKTPVDEPRRPGCSSATTNARRSRPRRRARATPGGRAPAPAGRHGAAVRRGRRR